MSTIGGRRPGLHRLVTFQRVNLLTAAHIEDPQSLVEAGCGEQASLLHKQKLTDAIPVLAELTQRLSGLGIPEPHAQIMRRCRHRHSIGRKRDL